MNSSQNNKQQLKRVNSASNFIISQAKNNNDEMTDDDELVQKSSIMSYQDEENQQSRQNVPTGKLRLQEEDIAEMDTAMLQHHLSTLRQAIGQLYLGIKQKTKDETDVQSPEEEREERDIIMSLDSYVIIEYIKSSVDIILNLKFEEIEKKLLDRNQQNNDPVSLSQDMDGSPQKIQKTQKHSTNSSQHDSANGNAHMDGPPQVYEEIIQKLEGEVRKHIRIEQQLKLHIDSMENRIEELENENEKIDSENNQIKNQNSLKNDSRVKELEELIKAKDDVIKMHEMQFKQLKESEQRLKKDLETIKGQMAQIVQRQKQQNSNSIECEQSGQIILNKTQPMILNQAMKEGGRKMQFKQHAQDSSLLQPQFGSYSSNNSFAMMVDGISPDRGRSTPDISGHPYLHQTQIVHKRKSIGPGTGSKSKKFAPNSVVESLGLQPQFNAINQTYTTASSGKILGQRRLSSQHGRNHQTAKGATAVLKATQNSWLGPSNSIQMPVTSIFPHHQQQATQLAGQPQFSNIINNNIQGLSINYQNQIIQPVDPIQRFANHFLGVQNTTNNNIEEDSESSAMNSHRRCKSQNLKRGSLDRKRKKHLEQQREAHEGSMEVITAKKLRKNINDGIPINQLEETTSFEGNLKNQQNNQFVLNGDSTNQLVNEVSSNELTQSNIRRQFIKQGQSITSSKVRSGSNRGMIIQQQNQAIDEFAKNRFNQSYGSTANGKSKATKNNAANNSSTNQSIEKSSNNVPSSSIGEARTRNKKKQNLTHNITVPSVANQYQVMNKNLDGNQLFDLNNFKTTVSTSNNQIPQQNTTQIIGVIDGQSNFSIPKQNNSATNTVAALLNEKNIHLLKQQILAHKKASNLLMKGGISPHKKNN